MENPPSLVEEQTMIHHAPALREYLGISLFWLAISFFWGAMLSIVLPDRVAQIAGPEHKDQVWGLISGCGAFLSGLTQIVFGALSDNSTHPMGRRRPYLIFGVLGTSVVLLFFPGANTVGALLGVYLGIQLFLNIANGPYQALLPDLISPAYYGRASAFLGISQTIGRIGGGALAGFVVSLPNGLVVLTWVFIVVLNGLMLANVLLLKETQHTQKEGVAATLQGLLRVPLKPYPSFVWLLVSRVGIMMGVYTVTLFLLYYVSDTMKQGEDAPMVVTKFLVLATVTGIFGTIPAGFVSDRFSKKKVLYVGNTICILAGTAFALANDLTMAYVAVGIFGLGFGIFAAVDWALACNLLPPGAPAKYLGIWSVSDTLPQVIAPLVAGPVAFAINQNAPGVGYRVLMGLAIVYFIIGTFTIAFIKEKRVSSASDKDILPQNTPSLAATDESAAGAFSEGK